MSRKEMLDMIKSPAVDPMVFNFDNMIAPPMLAFITPQDLQYLQYLANSLKLNAKLDYKYSEIDKVLTNRGFEKIGSGTNRVAYKHLEHPGICLKVAASRTACTDSPREMINQEYLKPFVAKIFEVDPTGTVALCERVDPIRNREEFMMIVDEVFDLITQWFTGKYVVDDIGTNFFMNWGTRLSNGFPVLHDYPYFYPLDPHKLICRKILEDGVTICNGEIDYDPGYNYLICTKCGKVYKAMELAKAAENNSILINEKKGAVRMRVKVKKGEDTLRTFDSVSEAKKLENRYATVESAMLKARVVAKKDEEYVKQLHASEEATAKDEAKLKVTIVSKEKSEFDTDGNFIPRDSSEEHEDNEVVVEKAPPIAGAGDPTKMTGDLSDGEIDHGEFDEEPEEETQNIASAITDAIYEAIEEGKDEVIDEIDAQPVEADTEDESDEAGEVEADTEDESDSEPEEELRVAGSPADPDFEDGRAEEDTVLVAGAGQSTEAPEEEVESEGPDNEVNDYSTVTEEGEVEESVVQEAPVSSVQESEDIADYEEEDDGTPKKSKKRSARYDPATYVEASRKKGK